MLNALLPPTYLILYHSIHTIPYSQISVETNENTHTGRESDRKKKKRKIVCQCQTNANNNDDNIYGLIVP